MQILGSLEQESIGKGPEVCILPNFPGEPRAANVFRSSAFFNLLSQCDVQKEYRSWKDLGLKSCFTANLNLSKLLKLTVKMEMVIPNSQQENLHESTHYGTRRWKALNKRSL